jgi:tetratricopeptide (TPR) repeat protein
LSGCRAEAATWLPADVVGTLETTRDAVLCALKAETLLTCGQFPQAAQFRRRAPRLAKTRMQALDLIHRLSPQDGQFHILVSEADAARDNRAWQAAAALYQQALALYPCHAGYRLQYAHCLRESGENIAAEIQYRSARALGAPWSDVAPPLETLTVQQGEPAPDAPPGPCPDAESLLDEPPTADDVRRIWVLAGIAPGDDAALLALLRMATSIRAVIGRVAAAGQADATGRRFLEDTPA